MEVVSSERKAEERRSAFDALATPLMKSVYNRAFQLTHRPEVAADLVQETYLRAFRTFDNFTAGTNARAWLHTILYSTFVSRYRKEKREPAASPLEEAEQSPAPAALESTGLAALNSKLWASTEVHAALSELSEEFRTVLLMVDVDDLSYEQVAEALQCPVGTVRSRLSRARKLTYAALESYARERGFLGKEP